MVRYIIAGLMLLYVIWIFVDFNRANRILFSIPRTNRGWLIQSAFRAVFFVLMGITAGASLISNLNTAGQILFTVIWAGIYVFITLRTWFEMKKPAAAK